MGARKALVKDANEHKIQAFVFHGGTDSNTLFASPLEEDTLVHIGADATINSVDFVKGDKIIFKAGVTYTFGANTPLGI